MDISMPHQAGPAATKIIKARWPDVRVLALTAHEDVAHARCMLDAGASGYVLKRTAAADLVRAIELVAKRGVYLDPAIAGQLVSSVRTRGEGELVGVVELSERESEVMRLIAEGHTMKAIAASLEVSVRTLETYKARAMEKLGLKNRADIVRYAVRRGWL
jgi:DNA-binding NarL/FixJ family response regulator